MNLLSIGPLILLLYFSIIIFLPMVSTLERPPNIVLIVADDFGRNDLGAYGSPDARTPMLDALASSGIRLDNFYGEPACTPSRYSLLTGFHPVDAPDRLMMRAFAWRDRTVGLRRDEYTLAEALKHVGYSTAIIGKWHLGHGSMVAEPPVYAAADSEFHPNNHGFDYFFGALSGAIDYNTHWFEDRFPDWFENKQYIPDRDAGTYATTAFTQRAVAYIDAQAQTSSPFFLYLPYTAPHYAAVSDTDPMAALQLPLDDGIARMYLSRFDEAFPSDDSLRKRYLAMVAAMDDGIGEVLSALERNHIRDHTLVIFISDNGAEPIYGGSNSPLRGGKATPYEGGVRVPAIISWRSTIAPGQSSPQFAHITDLYPTILSMIGYGHLARHVDGVDLSVHLLLNVTIHRDVHMANCYYGHFYREDDWKYVRLPKGSEALFNLNDDPSETTNVARLYPKIVTRLAAKHARIYGAKPCS